MKKTALFAVSFVLTAFTAFAGTHVETKNPAEPEEKNWRDKVEVEETYTLRGDFRDARFGSGNSFYGDYSYNHRFLISGNWYLRTGAEYERFDFGGSTNGLPNHLQGLYANIAFEYVVHDHAAAGIRLYPGWYFENHIRGNAFDMPVDVFFTFPIVKDKVFGVFGIGASLYQDPPVVPGGGIIWLISDKVRLEGVVPKPALVYNPNDNWEFRLLGEIVSGSFRTDEIHTPSENVRFSNAIVQYSEYRAGVQASFSGFKPFEVVVGAGYTFNRIYDFFRAERREVVEGAPYFKVAINAKF